MSPIPGALYDSAKGCGERATLGTECKADVSPLFPNATGALATLKQTKSSLGCHNTDLSISNLISGSLFGLQLSCRSNAAGKTYD